jgi:hypothetical protein
LIPRRSPFALLVLVILSIATLGGTIWASYQIASQEAGGGRFWIEWIAVRARVVDGVSPYSTTASNRIQNQVANLFTWAPGPEPTYTSPLISAIITLPFTLIPDANLAHIVWLVTQFAVILLTILAGMRLSGWKPALWFFLVLMPLILLSVRTMVSWYEGSMIVWVSALVAAVMLAIRGKRFELAGVLLAFTMIQPQAVILWVVLVLIWAGAQRKWALIFWFFSVLLILSVLAVFMVPDWPIQYLRILWNHTKYFSPGTPGYAFQQWWPGLGKQMGWALSAILGIILIIEWWLARRSNYRWFLWTACLTLAVSPWIGFPISPDAHLLLNLPLIIVIAMIEERWRRNGKWVILTGVGLVFVWEWVLILTNQGDMGPPMRLGLMFPVPMLLLIGIFWVRWWTIRPKRLLIDELRDSENY